MKFTGYRCSLCNQEYLPGQVTYICPKDGGNLDVVLDYNAIKKSDAKEKIFTSPEPSLWRYLPLLPVADPGNQETPLHAAGGTPVFAPQLLSKTLELKHLWIKDESRNPTASFKDRASAVVVARACEIKAEVVVTASTGNAGAALAGMSAAVGQKAVIFAPKTAPPAKVAQLLIYGAKVLLVDGTYDDAFDLTIQASQEFGWYCRNTGFNPFTAEGKKTAALEIWEWWEKLHKQSPLKKLKVFVSVGDGNIISGSYKGFKDLIELGWIDTLPGLYGVQAEGSAAIANAFNADVDTITPVSANTLADSISVDLPRDGVRAVRAARESNGSYVLVSDAEILSAISALGKAGIFAEPAGATAYAGLVRARQTGMVQDDDAVLVINTGNGLKDVKAAMQAAGAAKIIAPNLDSVKKEVGNINAEPTISIIAPIYNEMQTLPELYRRVSEVMISTGETWELLMVDDGSTDGTTEAIKQLADQDKHIKPVIFARNFGHQLAVTAGLDYARGKAVVIIDADLQDPPEVIVDMLKKWREGYEVVYAVRSKREENLV